MKAEDAVIAWNNNSDEIEVGPLNGMREWAKPYRMTIGACGGTTWGGKGDRAKLMVFIEAWIRVVRDGVGVRAVHNAFLKIDEYRDGLPDDALYPLRRQDFK